MSTNGKGDTPRPVDKQKFDENFERIFGKKPEVKPNPNTCPHTVTVANHVYGHRCVDCGEWDL